MLNILWSDVVGALFGAVVLLAACVVIEIVAGTERLRLRDRATGAMLVLIGSALAPVISWPLQKLWFALDLGHIVVPLWPALEPLGVVGYGIAVACFVLLMDFLRYWRHRAEHRWFWSIHKVHHSPTELHAANSIGHPLQVIPDFLFVSLPLSLFQFPGAEVPLVIGFVVSFLSVHIHSPVRIHFGPFRRIVVDNRFHRIHHSVEERHFDRNFGICFSFWDAMFGTVHWPKRGEWPDVGVQGERFPETVAEFLAMPFAKAQGIALAPKENAIDSVSLNGFAVSKAPESR
ncbi:sterol desaturase family protein [uncultured Sphingomonas sp.]|uniref:sterol desaturase family protein n=1 Tax=unclassified Sphingomonas TaxID=196159 RepID=UPI0025D14738|nr:sterol desaturase family protein [uncultured Sphingomonas sp.]